MDASLQIERHSKIQDIKPVSLHNQHEPGLNLRSNENTEYDVKPFLGAGTAVFPPEPKPASPKAQAWQRSSPGLAPTANPSSNECVLKQVRDVASDEGTAGESSKSSQKTPDHMRAPSTNSPTVHPLLGLDDARRRRSRSIGSSLRDPRIAALSVQLRSRLSYAAAKVEKKRQSQSSNQLLHHRSSTPILSAESLSRGEHPLPISDLDGHRSAANGSPNGTTVSAPDVPATSNIYLLEVPARSSPVSIADSMYPPSQHEAQKRSAASTPVDLDAFGLAPPVDIIPGRLKDQRRRPNPNISVNSPRYSPFSLHRRHHSQQELQIESEVVMVPETPPLRPLGHHALAPYNGLNENSQNSSMEQDAIETLIFMSSPETSGYHSNSQNSQNTLDTMAIDGAWPGVQMPGLPTDGQATSSNPALNDNNVVGAGDEIDQMLDQMDSDSDDDANYSSRLVGVRTGPAAGPVVGNSSLPGT
ncbi:hypothetical protein BJX64DRAFT_154741 [Aspergillus heterothallicus]